ncbi:MAG: CDP-diacylglycerol--glycerol-3-phosphate 3-phosphatidyltransferase [Bdellovibrionota bacterium]
MTRHVPNILTFIRLGLIPIFVYFLIEPEIIHLRIGLGIFIIASLTDYFDGWFARKYAVVTDFGKLFDPLVDKLLVMAALVMLASVPSEFAVGRPVIDAWIVVLILAREIWVTGLRAVAAQNGIIVDASFSGKFKSTLQMIAICILLGHDLSINLFDTD